MNIDSTSASSAATTTKSQARADFKSLVSDLQSGNLTAAQTDFASLLQDAPQLQNLPTTSQASSPTAAFSSLSSALQSGDLAGAQKALTTLQQSVHGHHHHGHHCDPDAATPPAGSATDTAPAAASVTL